jgi:FixJ family two-component response regulator
MPSCPVIAVVDDDESVRSATDGLIRSLGYVARTYASAEDFLNAAGDEPSCLVTDVQMPGMSGVDLQQSLLRSGRRLPIIFVTAFPNETVRRKALAAGACDFLLKPYDGEAFIRSLETALGHQHAA